MRRMSLLLRVEAGPQVGLGHLRRSISLAHAMEPYGVDGHFLMHPDPRGVAWAERSGQSGELVKGSSAFDQEDARQTLATARQLGTQSILLDYHDIPAEYVQRLREGGLKVMVRDDLALRALPVEIIVNGNADAEKLGYSGWGGGTRFLLGPRYAVLPKEYWQPAIRRTCPEVARVLVVLGGSDPSGLMPSLLERLDRMPGKFEIIAILGPFFENTATVQKKAQGLRKPVHLEVSPDSVAPWILEADLAVSAAGQTLYELACFGCPTVTFRVADNQQGQLEALAEAGCVRNVGQVNDPDLLDRIEQSLSEVIREIGLREAMARAGQGLIDGRGADRVAHEILQEVRK